MNKPLSPAGLTGSAGCPAPSTPAGACLLIEDNRFDRKRIRTVLERTGYDGSLSEAASLLDARRILFETEIDMILLDNRLPDGSGLDFVRELCSDGRINRIKVVMISSEEPAQISDVAIDAGCTDFIAKDELSFRRLRPVVGPRKTGHRDRIVVSDADLPRRRTPPPPPPREGIAATFRPAAAPAPAPAPVPMRLPPPISMPDENAINERIVDTVMLVMAEFSEKLRAPLTDALGHMHTARRRGAVRDTAGMLDALDRAETLVRGLEAYLMVEETSKN